MKEIEPTIICIGKKIPINYGEKNDPYRIKKIVGDFPNLFDTALDPNKFRDRGEPLRKGRDIDDWPTGTAEVNLWVCCFHVTIPGYGFPGFELLQELFEKLPKGFKKGGLPQLMTGISTENQEFLQKNQIFYLHAPDESSLWRPRDDYGNLAIPTLVSVPNRPHLTPFLTDYSLPSPNYFLLYEET